jgi:hypothetical protein
MGQELSWSPSFCMGINGTKEYLMCLIRCYRGIKDYLAATTVSPPYRFTVKRVEVSFGYGQFCLHFRILFCRIQACLSCAVLLKGYVFFLLSIRRVM